MKLKWYWKVIIAVGVIIAIGLISADIIVDRLAEKQVQKIKEQFAGKYDFSYEKLNVSILTKDVVLKNFKFFTVVDSSVYRDKFDFELDELNIHLGDYFGLIAEGKLDIKKIDIVNPKVVYGLKLIKESTDQSSTQLTDTTTIEPASSELFLKFLNIDELVLEDGKADVFRLIKPDDKILFIEDLDISFTGISIDFTSDSIIAGSGFETFVYNASNIYSEGLKDHELSIGNLHYDYSGDGFTISKFHIKNKKDKEAFNAERKYRTPWILVDVEEIAFNLDPWNFYHDEIFDLGKISLTKADITLYVDLNLELSPKIKPMPSKMIRSVPVKFNLDTLELIDVSFVFMNKMKGEKPGYLKLAPINGNMSNITNVPDFLKINPITKLDIDTKIWDEGIVEIEINIDVPNLNDPMQVDGKVTDLSFKKVDNMIKNLFGIEVNTGYIDLLEFHFDATDVLSTGEVVFDYHDLILDMKQQDRKESEGDEKAYKKKSNHFLNFMVGEAVRRDNVPGRKSYVPIGYIIRDRIRDKAFSDALWGSIQMGIFDIVLKDAFFDSRKKYDKKVKKEQRQENKAEKSDDSDNSQKKDKKKKDKG